MNSDYREHPFTRVLAAGWFCCLAAAIACAQNADSKSAPSSEPAAPSGMSLSKQTYTYKSIGDCQIKADVYRLPNAAVQPAILWIHGGALITGDRNGLRREQLERYLGAGFAVVSIDYRLAPETKLKGIIEDLRDAYKWLRLESATLKIDPDRIAVIGHSAGGYLTLMAGFSLNPRPQALVSFYGYGDIAGAWYSRPDPFYSKQPAVPKEEAYAAVGGPVISENPNRNRGRFYLYCRQQGLWPKEVAGHDPDQEPRAFDPFCPVRNMSREYPPTLLLHGDKDTDVPYEQSVQMARELARQKVEHDFITMTNRGHGFDGGREGLKDPVVVGTFDRIIGFLNKHVGHDQKAQK